MPSSLSLTIQGPPRRFFSHHALLRRRTIQRWIHAALLCPTAQITVRFVGRREGVELNQTYRGKPYATNVLSFDYNDTSAFACNTASSNTPAHTSTNISVKGDIVLCCPVIEKEAQEQHKTLLAHYAHLIIHGVLHLQGYDHQQDEQAQVMEALETTLLARLGFGPVY